MKMTANNNEVTNAVIENAPPASPVRLLVALLVGQQRRLMVAVLLTACSALLDLLVYYWLYLAAKRVLLNMYPASSLLWLAGCLTLTLLGKYVLLVSGGYFSHVAAFRVLYEIRLRLAYSLAKLPLSVLGSYSSGGLRKIILDDVEKLENFIAHNTIELISALVAPVVAAVFLFWLDWRMALAALCTVPLALIIQVILSRGMSRAVQRYNQATGQLNGATVEYLRGIPVIKAFRQTTESFRLLSDRLSNYYQLVADFTRHAVPGWSAFIVVLNANIFVLLPVGIWLHYRHSLDIAGLIMSVMLGSGLLKPVLKLLYLSSAGREIISSAGCIQPLLLANSQLSVSALPASGQVQLTSVNFSYQLRPVLCNISLKLESGSFNALVGPSGSGKSTLAGLLSGLLPATSGEILLGGVPLAALSDSERAKTIAVVSQDSFMFQGSLAQNLRLANPQASDQQLLAALEVAQAAELVASLPQELDTLIGERGARLSGGERQRIAIARALLAQTAMLVLDEATAFADSITEAAFYQALRQHYPAITVLVIAHRLYAVRQAEQIILLEQGRVSAVGRHEQLLHSNTTYKTLWDSQFSAQTWHIRQQQGALS